MTIENLRCFLILAQELNYTRAAQKAHVTQTTMSRKISSIETELSVTLFHRNHHQVGLTSAGQEFYDQIRTVLEQYDSAVIQAQNADKTQRDSVQIGVGIYEHTLISPVIQAFIQRYPVQKLNFLQFKYRELLDEFMHDRVDMIVTSDQFLNTVPQENLDKILLYDHPWVLALHRENPLALFDAVNMDLLKNENIITMNEGSINTVRNIFQQWFPVSALDYVNSSETKLLLVDANRGVGFLPSFVNTSRYPNIVVRKLNPLYRPRKFYAVIKKSNSNPYVHCLSRMLDEYYRNKLWLCEL